MTQRGRVADRAQVRVLGPWGARIGSGIQPDQSACRVGRSAGRSHTAMNFRVDRNASGVVSETVSRDRPNWIVEGGPIRRSCGLRRHRAAPSAASGVGEAELHLWRDPPGARSPGGRRHGGRPSGTRAARTAPARGTRGVDSTRSRWLRRAGRAAQPSKLEEDLHGRSRSVQLGVKIADVHGTQIISSGWSSSLLFCIDPEVEVRSS